MMQINFKIIDDRLTMKEPVSRVVSGNTGSYTCKFENNNTDSELTWYAVFFANDGCIYRQEIIDGICYIPSAAINAEHQTTMRIGVYGTVIKESEVRRVSTNLIGINIVPGGYSEKAIEDVPSHDVWENMILKAVPIIGENDNWFVYDFEKQDYVDTNVCARGQSGVGVNTGEGSEVFNDYENNKIYGKFSHAENKTGIIGEENSINNIISSHFENQAGVNIYPYKAMDLEVEGEKPVCFRGRRSNISKTELNNINPGDIIVAELSEKAKLFAVISECDLTSNIDEIVIKFNEYYLTDPYSFDGGNIHDAKVLILHYRSEEVSGDMEYVLIKTDLYDLPNIVKNSHGEGTSIVSDSYQHGEGYNTRPYGGGVHTEGKNTLTFGDYSHAEGKGTGAFGFSCHSEGSETRAIGSFSHAEGKVSYSYAQFSHAEGCKTGAKGSGSHAEGIRTIADGRASHSEGQDTTAAGDQSHAEGSGTKSQGFASHSEGVKSIASGVWAHAEGSNTKATEDAAHAEGFDTEASGSYSHSEGYSSSARNHSSHAEGYITKASGLYSHSEGTYTEAVGDTSHAEGYATRASGDRTHAEGSYTVAVGTYSHAEGNNTEARGSASHSEGLHTIAKGHEQHVQGKFNVEDVNNKYAHIVGNGTGESEQLRSNAHTLDWDGNSWYAGNIKIGGKSYDDKTAKEIATNEYVETQIEKLYDIKTENIHELLTETAPIETYGNKCANEFVWISAKAFVPKYSKGLLKILVCSVKSPYKVLLLKKNSDLSYSLVETYESDGVDTFPATIEYNIEAGKDDLYVGLYSPSNALCYSSAVTTKNDLLVRANLSDFSAGEETSVSLVSGRLNFSYSLTIETKEEKVANKKEYLPYDCVVDINGTGDFTSINAAILYTNEKDTIYIKKGLYKEQIKMFGKNRHLIGESKHDTLIVSESKDYGSEPIQANMGVIENLTFVAGYGLIPIEKDTVTNSYAIHIESPNPTPYELIIENCNIISNVASAIGMGVRYNQKVTVKDCYLETKAKQMYSTMYFNYFDCGAIFCHNDASGENLGKDGYLSVENCELKGVTTALTLQSQENGNTLTHRFLKNTLWSTEKGKENAVTKLTEASAGHLVGSDGILDPISFGNNISEINA